jgi:hypothetical protein
MSEITIKIDASGNVVRFRSDGKEPLAPSAGRPVTAVRTGSNVAIHGTLNNGNAPQIVFDNDNPNG